MPQAFRRSFNVLSKVSILGAVFILAALGWIGARTARGYYGRFRPVPKPISTTLP
jgi:hypothetical protein